MIAQVLLGVLKALVFVCDLISMPFYLATQPTFKDRTKQNLGQVKRTDYNKETVGFTREKGKSVIYSEMIVNAKVDTVTKAFDYAVKKHGDRTCLGTRQVLGEEDEMQHNGKIFKKLSLGDYEWMTYKMVHASSVSFGAGLRKLGLLPGDCIAIFAETRAEWIISCLGAFSQNISVATLYANLGDEAIAHAIGELKVKVLVTSHELLPKFKTQMIASKASTSCLETIIFMEDQLQATSLGGYSSLKLVPFRSVVTDGAQALSLDEFKAESPTPEDTAIIMYTSGSTGLPKGVVMSHMNLVATMKCLMFMVEPQETDLYIAYLPLAHVLELMSEITMLIFGIRVGYSSPNTMTDLSTKVMKGCKGDASILRPTMMCAVPLIMDRIYKNVMDSVRKRGVAFQSVFNFFFDYKLFWVKRGFRTPLLDKIVFSKIQGLLGGRMRFVIVGGAPLSGTTHDFIRVCFDFTMVQGYSLSESCCTGTVMENSDLSTDNCGRPMTDVEVRLVNWEEGDYLVTDKPNPRGEILLRGEPIAKGYFAPIDGQENDFFTSGGCRWFRTGDIGEFDSKGTLKIIDRKKDLVKLQLGEYVSLGKVEAILKTHPLVENICIYGDSNRSFVVSLVVPSKPHLEALAAKMGKTTPYDDLFDDPDMARAVLKELVEHGHKGNCLAKFETPHDLTLVKEQWTPDSGLVTASFKMKRKAIQKFYQRQIDRMLV